MTSSLNSKSSALCILIHTSVKLVTQKGHFKSSSITHFNPHEREARDPHNGEYLRREYELILIHTSVKLVTGTLLSCYNCIVILIHTSVKLVTLNALPVMHRSQDFNPHEREARDRRLPTPPDSWNLYFNPHEREARDLTCEIRIWPFSIF